MAFIPIGQHQPLAHLHAHLMFSHNQLQQQQLTQYQRLQLNQLTFQHPFVVNEEPQCKKLFEESGNDLRKLFAMSRGLKNDDGSSSVRANDDVFRFMKKESMMPSKMLLIAEIFRRQSVRGDLGREGFDLNRRKIDYYYQWLDANPITNPVDVAFLLTQLQHLVNKAEAFNNARLESSPEELDALLAHSGLIPISTALEELKRESEMGVGIKKIKPSTRKSRSKLGFLVAKKKRKFENYSLYSDEESCSQLDPETAKKNKERIQKLCESYLRREK